MGTSNQSSSQPSPQSRYQYTPFPAKGQWIRVLTLRPGCPSDTIKVILSQINLADPCEYEALSYVWGSTEDPGIISVDEIDGHFLSVTRNLYVTLQHLRDPKQEKCLWIDAICINQEDLVERGRQVEYMYSVYEKAHSVLVWLGPEADDSDLAIQQLDDIGSNAQVVWGGKKGDYALLPRHPGVRVSEDMADETASLEISARVSDALAGLLARPWFERVWIRQEVHPANLCFREKMWAHFESEQGNGADTVLTTTIHEPSEGPGATRLQCGTASMSWWNFRNALTCLEQKITRGTVSFGTSSQLANLGSCLQIIRANGYSWSSLSRMTKNTKCTDKRDRIFAMANIVGFRDKRFHVKPDYTRGTVETIQDFTLSYIKHSRSLDILAQAFQDGATDPRQPSWIPNWTREPLIHIGPGNPSASYCASGHLFSAVNDIGNGSLAVPAVLMDKIETLFVSFSDIRGSTETKMAEDCWQKVVPAFLGDETLDGSYPAGGTYLDALAGCLTWITRTSDHTDTSPVFLPSLTLVKSVIRSLCRTISDSDYADESTAEAEEFRKVQQAVWESSQNYGLFRTPCGLIGMAPSWARAGQRIGVLVGCRLPFVLSHAPDADSASRYRIEGPCYVHGFMYGEALLGSLPPHVDVPFSFTTGGLVFRDSKSGTWDREDPRVSALFNEKKLGEYRAEMKAGECLPVLVVDMDDLKRLNPDVEYILLF